jgi:glycosyltransferase involved in cell wall biosynthesis
LKSVAIIGTRGYPSYYGGFETAVRHLAPYLASQGWDVTVYGRRGATKPDDPTLDRRVHTPITWGLETKSVSTLSYGLTATIDAARKKPDVVLVMNVANGYFLPLLRARGIPSLVNVDGIEWDRAKWGRLAKLMFRTGARLTAGWGTRLVYDAKAIGARWKKDFGVDGVFIPYGGSEPETLPVEPGLDHRGYVLIVARFVPENTVPEFIEAARIISLRFPVVFVGSEGYGGELDERVKTLVETSDDVHWFGHISDDLRLLSLWQHAGAYFHGHSVGGTNPALVQAMACGAPVVARDTVYNREVLGEAGAFTGTDPAEIAENVLRVISDASLSERLSRDGKERAKAQYTWDIVNERYRLALESLIKGRK